MDYAVTAQRPLTMKKPPLMSMFSPRGIARLWPVFAPSELQCWAAKRWKIEDLSDPMNKILEVYPVKPQKFAWTRLLWMVRNERHGGYWALIIQHPFFQNMICKWFYIFYIPLPHLLLRYLLRGQVVTPAPAISFKRSGCHTCSCLSVDPDCHIRSSTWPPMKVRCCTHGLG